MRVAGPTLWESESDRIVALEPCEQLYCAAGRSVMAVSVSFGRRGSTVAGLEVTHQALLQNFLLLVLGECCDKVIYT